MIVYGNYPVQYSIDPYIHCIRIMTTNTTIHVASQPTNEELEEEEEEEEKEQL